MVECNDDTRTIYFFGDIDEEAVGQAIYCLDLLVEEDREKTIYIEMCSFGGCERSGFALYDKIKSINNDVVIIATGCIESMALIVYLAGDSRFATKSCSFMNHKGTDSIEGDIHQLESHLKINKELEKKCNTIVSENTILSLEEAEKQICGCDYFFDVEEAKKLGIVTGDMR
jgi:ATP-dependent Clp endopeptidase proteolytic subunit ClpP